MSKWKKLSSKIVYKSEKLKLREDLIILPDGVKRTYNVVEIDGGVMVLPVDEDGEIYLVNQMRYIPNAGVLEIPGGGVDGSESRLQAAKRELLEEAGLEADEWIELGSYYPHVSVLDEVDTVFLARKLIKGKAKPVAGEFLQLKKFSLAELDEMIVNNQIMSSDTITAVYKYKLFLEREK